MSGRFNPHAKGPSPFPDLHNSDRTSRQIDRITPGQCASQPLQTRIELNRHVQQPAFTVVEDQQVHPAILVGQPLKLCAAVVQRAIHVADLESVDRYDRVILFQTSPEGCPVLDHLNHLHADVRVLGVDTQLPARFGVRGGIRVGRQRRPRQRRNVHLGVHARGRRSVRTRRVVFEPVRVGHQHVAHPVTNLIRCQLSRRTGDRTRLDQTAGGIV